MNLKIVAGVIVVVIILIVWYFMSNSNNSDNGTIVINPTTLSIFTVPSVNTTMSQLLTIINNKKSVYKPSMQITNNGVISATYILQPSSLSIAPNSSATVSVIFKPLNDSNLNAKLTIDSTTINLIGHIDPVITPNEGSLSLDKSTLDFGNVIINSNKSLAFTIVNDTANSYDITSAIDGPYAITNLLGNIPSNSSVSMNVVFSPNSLGALSGQINLTVNSTTLKVTLNGTGIDGPAPPPPKPVDGSIIAQPAMLNFGTVNVNESNTLSLNINNISNNVLNLNAPVINGPLTVSALPKYILYPGEFIQLDVTYSPLVMEDISGYIKIIYYNETSSYIQIPISGTPNIPVVEPPIIPPVLPTVQGNLTAISNIVFDPLVIGNIVTKSFTVTNKSNVALTPTAPVVTGPFSAIVSSNNVMNPGDAISISVSYSPSTLNDKFGSISFGAHSDAYTQSGITTLTIAVSLSGTPLDVPLTGLLVPSVSVLDFGSVLIGERVTNVLSITNNTNKMLYMWTDSPSGYEISYNNKNLNPGDSININVTYVPKSPQDTNNVLTFTASYQLTFDVTTSVILKGTPIGPTYWLNNYPGWTYASAGIDTSNTSLYATAPINANSVEDCVKTCRDTPGCSVMYANSLSDRYRPTCTFLTDDRGLTNWTLNTTNSANPYLYGLYRNPATEQPLSGTISITPSVTQLGLIAPGSTKAFTVTITNNTNKIITNVTSPVATVSVGGINPGDSNDLYITYTAGPTPLYNIVIYADTNMGQVLGNVGINYTVDSYTFYSKYDIPGSGDLYSDALDLDSAKNKCLNDQQCLSFTRTDSGQNYYKSTDNPLAVMPSFTQNAGIYRKLTTAPIYAPYPSLTNSPWKCLPVGDSYLKIRAGVTGYPECASNDGVNCAIMGSSTLPWDSFGRAVALATINNNCAKDYVNTSVCNLKTIDSGWCAQARGLLP